MHKAVILQQWAEIRQHLVQRCEVDKKKLDKDSLEVAELLGLRALAVQYLSAHEAIEAKKSKQKSLVR